MSGTISLVKSPVAGDVMGCIALLNSQDVSVE